MAVCSTPSPSELFREPFEAATELKFLLILVTQCSAGNIRFRSKPWRTDLTLGLCTNCRTKRWDWKEVTKNISNRKHAKHMQQILIYTGVDPIRMDGSKCLCWEDNEFNKDNKFCKKLRAVMACYIAHARWKKPFRRKGVFKLGGGGGKRYFVQLSVDCALPLDLPSIYEDMYRIKDNACWKRAGATQSHWCNSSSLQNIDGDRYVNCSGCKIILILLTRTDSLWEPVDTLGTHTAASSNGDLDRVSSWLTHSFDV